MALELSSSGLDFMLLDYGADTDKTPSGPYAPADRHAVSLISANWPLELNLNYATLPGAGYHSHCCGCAHIEHKGLAGVNGLHAGLVCDTHHPLQELHIHGKGASGWWKLSRLSCHLAHQGIALGHDGIKLGAQAHQAARSYLIQGLLSGQQSHHLGLNGDPLLSAFVIYKPARTDLDLISDMENSLAQGAADDPTLEGIGCSLPVG